VNSNVGVKVICKSRRWPDGELQKCPPPLFAVTLKDRLALAIGGGCLGLVLGAALSLAFPTFLVVWYVAGYFAVASFILGPAAADIIAMVLAALMLLLQGIFGASTSAHPLGYERNPFDKLWQWVAFAVFVGGFLAIVRHAAAQ